jgi:hypothetical protein
MGLVRPSETIPAITVQDVEKTTGRIGTAPEQPNHGIALRSGILSLDGNHRNLASAQYVHRCHVSARFEGVTRLGSNVGADVSLTSLFYGQLGGRCDA